MGPEYIESNVAFFKFKTQLDQINPHMMELNGRLKRPLIKKW